MNCQKAYELSEGLRTIIKLTDYHKAYEIVMAHSKSLHDLHDN